MLPTWGCNSKDSIVMSVARSNVAQSTYANEPLAAYGALEGRQWQRSWRRGL
jgi:hypothetical protein